MVIKLSIKYCGNCNPQINGKSLYNCMLKRIMALELDIEMMQWENHEVDVLIVLSGCPIDCATRPEKISEEFIIAGETFNRVPCDEQKLVDQVIESLIEYNKKNR